MFLKKSAASELVWSPLTIYLYRFFNIELTSEQIGKIDVILRYLPTKMYWLVVCICKFLRAMALNELSCHKLHISGEKIKGPSADGEAKDGSSIFLTSDASGNCNTKYGRLRGHRFLSSVSPQTTDDGYQQSLGQPALRSTISQRSHLMSSIPSHHTVVFIIIVLLHSFFTSGSLYFYFSCFTNIS